MRHIKGKSPIRYWLLTALFALGILLAPGPAMAEDSPTDQAELATYQLESPAAETAQMTVCTPDIPDMIAYWPLDDEDTGAGTLSFANYMGTSDGACTKPGCPTETTGKVNGAYTFVPDTDPDTDTDLPDKINVPAFAGLNWANTDSFSFETWVKIPATATCKDNKVFIGRRGMGVLSIWLGCTDGSNAAGFRVRDNTNPGPVGHLITGTTPLNDGAWHHVVGVRDGAAAKLHIYVDGALEGSADATFLGSFSSNQDLTIGYFAPPPYYYLNGTLDEMAIYSRALTLANVQAHYNNGNGESYCTGAPVVTNPGDQQHSEGTVISLQIQATDPDSGDPLTYSATGLPPNLSINATTGLISGTIAYNASPGSPYQVEVTVKDSTNASTKVGFKWAVTDVQATPVITNPGNKTNKEGASISLQIQASDPDGGALTYTATGLPPNLAINQSNGLISGIIGCKASSGSPYTVMVTVKDPTNKTASANFTWTVTNDPACKVIFNVYLPVVVR